MKKFMKALWAVLVTTLDAANLFSSDQAITATANSTNVVDVNGAGKDGSGRTVGFWVTETFTLLTSLTVALHTDSDSAFGTDTLVISTSVAAADLVAGKFFELPIPHGMLQYGRVTYTVVGTNPNAGTITAGVILDGGKPTAFEGGTF